MKKSNANFYPTNYSYNNKQIQNDLVYNITNKNLAKTKDLLHQVDPTLLIISNLVSIDSKFEKLSDKFEIFNIIYDKISTYEQTHRVAKEDLTTLLQLKGFCLYYQAKTTIEQNKEQELEQVKFQNYQDSLTKLEEAHTLLQQNKKDIKKPENKLKEIGELITEIIFEYKTEDESFDLAEKSLQYRKRELGNEHPSVIDALKNCYISGFALEDSEIHEKALEYAEEAYDIAHKLKKGTKEISDFIEERISKYEDHEEAYELAKKSVAWREKHTKSDDNISYLSALQLAYMKGFLLDDIELKKEALLYGEQAYDLAIRINHQSKAEIAELIKNNILEYDHKEYALEFAKQSLQFRKPSQENNQGRRDDDPTILDALKLAANVGFQINSREAKIEALQLAQESYSMAVSLDEKEAQTETLELIAKMFGHFGDTKKQELINKQVKAISGEVYDEDNNEDSVQFYPIKKMGSISAGELKIKEKIQEKILNPIMEAAAKGKWTDVQIIKLPPFSADYGVSGYVDKFFIQKILGENLNTPNNVMIAQALCFEAINIGIMSSKNPNPLCAAIFVEKFPSLMSKIISEHPEYFVDAFILNTSYIKAHENKDLVGEDYALPENKDGYNHAFEKAITPFIEERLETSIFEPIETLVLAQKSKEETEKGLSQYLSENYLTQKHMTSNSSFLGNNLSAIPDVVSILRILAFKKIIDATLGTNFDAAVWFIKTYPELFKRIKQDHSDYYTEKGTLTTSCDEALVKVEDALKKEEEEQIKREEEERIKREEEEKKKEAENNNENKDDIIKNTLGGSNNDDDQNKEEKTTLGEDSKQNDDQNQE